jgi:hypothetical protein
MHSQQITWNPQAGWTAIKAENVSLVFYFGTRQLLACGKRYNELREMFPEAHWHWSAVPMTSLTAIGDARTDRCR